MSIEDYGWDEYFARQWKERCAEKMFPGRIIADYGQMLRVVADPGEVLVNRPLQKHDNDLQGRSATGQLWSATQKPDGCPFVLFFPGKQNFPGLLPE